MIDFSSALYLGVHHPSTALRGFKQLTTGVPAALREPLVSRSVADRLAALAGYEAGLLSPSTLHLFWDLPALLPTDPVGILVDRMSYPVARWGAARIACGGRPVAGFRHHDLEALGRAMTELGSLRPVVLSDGYCPSCGRFAPLRGYLRLIRQHGGLLVIDDTQALGIFGAEPSDSAPFGRGGGGSLRRLTLESSDVIAVSSLAKAFGAPLAVLMGDKSILRRFARASSTRVHSSPPSMAAVQAAALALRSNRALGDRLRFRLAQVIRLFREGARGAGVEVGGGLFPVQYLTGLPPAAMKELHRRLRGRGITSVLVQSGCQSQSAVAFMLTARHKTDEIRKASNAVAASLNGLTVEKGRDHAYP